jgi:spore coat polysaccharide biosynthesis protein SpsF
MRASIRRTIGTGHSPVITCIVVRLNSTRLPRKALADLCGQPMLERLINRVRAAKSAGRIVVCTSDHPGDQAIVSLARECGAEAVVASEIDVLSRLELAAARFRAETIVRVTGDNPFTDPQSIDEMVTAHRQSGADYTRVMGMPLGSTAEVLSVSILGHLRSTMGDPRNSEYLMLYAFDPERFRCRVLRAPQHLRRPYYSVTVDTPEDLALARDVFVGTRHDGTGPSIGQIVGFLDAREEYKGIPASAMIRLPDGESLSYGSFLERMEARAAFAEGLETSRGCHAPDDGQRRTFWEEICDPAAHPKAGCGMRDE